MATLEEIVVQLTAETAGLKAELNSANKTLVQATGKMDKAIEEFSKSSSKNVSFFQNAMATMTGFLAGNAVMGAFNALKDVVGSVSGALLDGAQSALAEEQALTRLSSSLRQTGQFSQEALTSLADFAGEMETLTGVGDDVVASNLAVLSSLTKLDAEGLKSAQMAALDLSAALGKDLSTTTEMVAKAVNGNDMAFKKLGVTLNLTSDETANLANVTEALSNRFGGAAAAKMQTFGGAVTGLRNSFGNFVEELATSVTKNDVFIAVMNEGAKVLARFQQFVKDNAVELRDGLAQGLITVIDALVLVGKVGDAAFRTLKVAFNTIQIAAASLTESLLFLYSKISGGPEVDFSETKAQYEDLSSAFLDTNAIDSATQGLENIRAVASNTFDQMKGKQVEVLRGQEGLQNTIQTTTALTEEQSAILSSFATGLANQTAALDSQFKFANAMLAESNAQKMALTQEDYAAQIAAQEEFFALKQELTQAQFEQDTMNLETARQNNLITEQEYQQARIALGQNYALENAKQQTAITAFNAAQEKQRQDNFKSTMSTISGLASSGNKELAAIGKAAAITNATIDGFAAVQKALASAPPPFNFALAAAVGAATAANVAKIAGTPLKTGITEVPRSSSGGNSGDNFPAILSPGERVVDSQTNQDLKAFLANQGGGGAQVSINVNVMPGTGLNNEQIGNLIEQMNNYFTSGGLRLVGST